MRLLVQNSILDWACDNAKSIHNQEEQLEVLQKPVSQNVWQAREANKHYTWNAAIEKGSLYLKTYFTKQKKKSFLNISRHQTDFLNQIEE